MKISRKNGRRQLLPFLIWVTFLAEWNIFPLRTKDAWNCIKRLIPQCDFYVILLAGKYGSIPKNGTKSYTHMEYELAQKHEIPIIRLIHNRPDDLPNRHCENEPKIKLKLDRFRLQVGEKLRRSWSTADQIPGELLFSLTHQMNLSPRVGWVRADCLASEEAKSEIIQLRKKLEKAEAQITKFEKVRAEQESELASGSDELILTGNFNAVTYADPERTVPTTRLWAKFEVKSTWDKLLRVLTSRKEDVFTSNNLNYWLQEAIQDEIYTTATGSDGKILGRISVSLDVGENVKITTQLSALNLIAPRKSYPEWGFTPKGLFQGSRQRALRKGELHAGQLSWCRVSIKEIEKAAEDVSVENW